MVDPWSQNQYGGITREGCFLAQNEVIATANADCERYEAKIAALTAERDEFGLAVHYEQYNMENEIESLKSDLAACAAGPWRFDVENAPRDGSEVIIAWRLPRFGNDPNPIYQNYARWYGRRFGFRDVAINPEYIIAFAVPNPPQVTTGKAFDIPEWRDNDSGGYVQ